MIHSSLLFQLDWLEHGFGTRSAPLSQDGMAALTQIHSAEVLKATAPGLAGRGDALVTDLAGLPVSVRTADCYPILLADTGSRTVAAIHAGWRGTAAHIVGAALKEMNADPRRLFAAIGPGIGGCCYEVGEEVAQQFGQHAGLLDLAEVNYRQLINAGVPPSQIDVIRRCTFCEPGHFHSFRRDKDHAGRMISYISRSA